MYVHRHAYIIRNRDFADILVPRGFIAKDEGKDDFKILDNFALYQVPGVVKGLCTLCTCITLVSPCWHVSVHDMYCTPPVCNLCTPPCCDQVEVEVMLDGSPFMDTFCVLYRQPVDGSGHAECNVPENHGKNHKFYGMPNLGIIG